MIMGKLPESWWSTWEARKGLFEDEVEGDGRAVWIGEAAMVAHDKASGSTSTPEPRSIKDLLKRGLYYECEWGPGGFQRDISQEEIEVFSDLLMKILRYDPKERLSASSVLDHAWFKM